MHTLDNVTLRRRKDDRFSGAVKKWRYNPPIVINLKGYDVISAGGVVIGVVGQEMQTFERSSKGRNYVNRRWSSPRWFYFTDPDAWDRGSWTGRESRKAALEDLLHDLNKPKGDE